MEVLQMTQITLCAACSKKMEDGHTCQNPNSLATGTITYKDQMFGLVKKVSRFHDVVPRGGRRRFSQWYEYHGPKSYILLTAAMLLFGKRTNGDFGLVVTDGDSSQWVFFNFKWGLYGLPTWWTTSTKP